MKNQIASHNTNIAARNDIFFALFVFIFFFIFYSVIHPLIPIDLDDWSFIVKNRIFLPLWGDRNPTKIFPEYFYPLMSSIGADLIYPINNDYLQSQCIIHSIVVSLSITGYTLSFLHFIKSKFSISISTSYQLSLLFLMLHFLIFRTEETNNIYMFYANDVNCYYNYIIPDLLCASIVFSLLGHDWLKEKVLPTFKNSMLFVLLYLAVCSNLYSSIIFIGFIICDLLIDLLSLFHTDKNYNNYLKSNRKKICIVFFWLLVHLFEAFGQRAKEAFETQAPLFDSIATTISHISDIHVSKLFTFIFAFIVLYTIYLYIKKDLKNNILIYKVICTFFICFIYIVLLSSKVDPLYITSNTGNYSFFFYVLLLMCIGFTLILQNIKISIFSLPFVILLLFSFINRTSNTFCDIWKQYNYITLYEITHNNINKILYADKHHIKGIDIIVPKFNHYGNWPLNIILNYENALYKHGIIKNHIKVKIIKGKNISEWENNNQFHDN